MIDIITVGNTVWNIDRRNPLGSGIDASAFESKTYPDVVLLLFSKKFEYKYDWYQYLDLIMGESEWKDRHVLILPKMAHISIPQWYGMLDVLMRGRSMQNSLYVANQYLDGIYPLHEEDQWAADDPNIRKWMESFVEFLDMHPQYVDNKYFFDLHKYNIMSLDGELIITDPIVLE